MAQNYTFFSFTFPVHNELEHAWIKENLDTYANADSDDFQYSAGFATDLPYHQDDASFDLAIWADESGDSDVEAVIAFIESFFRAMRPTGGFGFEWANTCSKPRPGEFGGGAAFIFGSRATTRCFSTSSWLADQYELLESRVFELKRIEKKPPPLASEIKVTVWEERDRLHIAAFVNEGTSTTDTVAEWWDDEARSMIEGGFFTYDCRPGRLGTTEVGPKLLKSVREYLVNVKLAKEG
jgi:hypothetical protein